MPSTGPAGGPHEVTALAPAAMPLPSEQAIPELVAQVYEAAPAVERGRLLEPLLRPLGVLSLFGIADGVFAQIRFRSGWRDMHVRLEDIQHVSSEQVVSLVDHVQQVSVEAVDALAQVLTTSPMLSGSAATAALVAVLVQRARRREALVGRKSSHTAGLPPHRPA
jgi:hypothetical protein